MLPNTHFWGFTGMIKTSISPGLVTPNIWNPTLLNAPFLASFFDNTCLKTISNHCSHTRSIVFFFNNSYFPQSFQKTIADFFLEDYSITFQTFRSMSETIPSS